LTGAGVVSPENHPEDVESVSADLELKVSHVGHDGNPGSQCQWKIRHIGLA
jgi:hypothetical protein